MTGNYPRITAAHYETFIENGRQYQESVETTAQEPCYTPDHPHRELFLHEIEEVPSSVLPNIASLYRINPILAISLHAAVTSVDNSIFAAATGWTGSCGQPVACHLPPHRILELGIGPPPVLKFPAIFSGQNPFLNTFKTKVEAISAWKEMQCYMRSSLAWKAAAFQTERFRAEIWRRPLTAAKDQCTGGRFPEWRWIDLSPSYAIIKKAKQNNGVLFSPGIPLTVAEVIHAHSDRKSNILRSNISSTPSVSPITTGLTSGSSSHYRPHMHYDCPTPARPIARASYASSKPISTRNRSPGPPKHPKNFTITGKELIKWHPPILTLSPVASIITTRAPTLDLTPPFTATRLINITNVLSTLSLIPSEDSVTEEVFQEDRIRVAPIKEGDPECSLKRGDNVWVL
ncbi:hypothetical protein M422DRAFT_268503 [Sphaerobolus stellatus SS14]|uniref:Uncharacterized protein n=1 Tax=Sphaerobolus stellatus (strain SS14) TaxID=990650 RepID=A0A0C9UMJ0_SPHS4|nr:hypothetical protein M422DRAFT_268503 [Sphaerobolus stellatus SS14]